MTSSDLPALIFDLDGTLVDTAPDLLAAMNAVLVAQGRRTVDPETLRHMVGFGAASLIRQAMAATGEPVSEDRLPALVDDFVVHYREHLADESVPFPGVVETLAALQQDGAKMGVLTNKPHELALPLLSALGLSKFFGAIHGAGRFSYVKPDPRVFHHVVEELAGDANAPAVMIGDSTTDAKTAQAAAVPVILLSYGYTPDPVETLGADAVTDDFTQIPALARHLAGR
ncbi:MAG TPA: HAD-IA family hydrolase [Rhizomicrobium sp.]|nr:HAD-IA family hydrolase [Rhizomicrobium sp.]